LREFVLLKKAKDDLQMKRANLEKIVLKFSKGEENLNTIVCTQRTSFNKKEIGFNPFNKKKLQKLLC